MVRPITSSSMPQPPQKPTQATTTTEVHEIRPGKSDDAVGQRAKAAIAPLTEGSELPRNAQGKAASALARGALSIDALFRLQGAGEPAGDDRPPVEASDEASVVDESDEVPVIGDEGEEPIAPSGDTSGIELLVESEVIMPLPGLGEIEDN